MVLRTTLTLMTLATSSTTSAFSPTIHRAFRAGMATRVEAAAVESTDAYTRLSGVELFRTTDGRPVELVNEWSDDDVAVVTFFRSFG